MKFFTATLLISLASLALSADPCPGQPDGPLPDQTDCQWYYWCSNGVGKRHDCPDGQLYNHPQKMCDWPENVTCPDVPTPPTPEQTTTAEDTTTTDSTVTETTTSEGETTTEDVETSTDEDPDTTTEDADTTTEDTDTTTETPTETTTLPAGGDDCPASGTANFPIPGNCDYYRFCLEGEQYIEKCGEGTEFDEVLKICRLPKDVTCNACPLEDPEERPVYVANRQDCNKYFVCRNREQIPLQCDEKLHFDEKSGTCLHPEDAECRYAFW